MSAELLVICVVAIIVFGPNKLPMLAQHLGLALRRLEQFKGEASKVWQQQLNQLQLQENKRKAEKADQHYR